MTAAGADAARGRHPTARAGRAAAQRPGLYLGLAFLVAVFNLLGLVMVMSASSVVARDDYGSAWYFVVRQAAWAAAGAVALLVIARTDYHRWRRPAGPLLGVSLAAARASASSRASGSASTAPPGGSAPAPSRSSRPSWRSWPCSCGWPTCSPAGPAHMHNTRATLRPVIVVLAAVATLVMLQPNLGTTIVIAAIALSLSFVAGTPIGALAGWATCSLAAAVALALAEPYRRARVLTFLDPWADPMDKGYQNIQSLVGLGSGGVVRRGPRRQPGQVGLPALRPLRLHLRHHRRGARPRRLVRRRRAVRPARHHRRAHRPARPRPVRAPAGDRRHGLVLHAGVRQHRCRDRHPPHHGRPPAVRQRRRVVARVRHGRRGAAAVGGPAGHRPPPSAPAAGPIVVPAAGRRTPARAR